jgi:hypothetical protein
MSGPIELGHRNKRHGAPGGTGRLAACPLAGGAPSRLGWVTARRPGGRAPSWALAGIGRTKRAPSKGPPGCVCASSVAGPNPESKGRGGEGGGEHKRRRGASEASAKERGSRPARALPRERKREGFAPRPRVGRWRFGRWRFGRWRFGRWRSRRSLALASVVGASVVVARVGRCRSRRSLAPVIKPLTSSRRA